MSFVVALKPTPGFCIKSSSVESGVYATRLSSSPLTVPKGLKVFINIGWDSNVPAPPQASENAIRRAMVGEDGDVFDPDGWYVPVVVSEGRQDTDKAGRPSLVFDAVFNSSLKSRTLKDPDFKVFLIELAFQRLEADSSIRLSRQISSPNILSKGKLEQRTVHIPGALSNKGAPENKLIQEITPVGGAKHKSILKSTPAGQSSVEEPSWSWSKNDQRILLTVSVPKLRRDLVASSTLDLEPRRFLLHIPSVYSLDINLDFPDERLENSDGALSLKRMRDFDVDGAKAEWRVADGVLVVDA